MPHTFQFKKLFFVFALCLFLFPFPAGTFAAPAANTTNTNASSSNKTTWTWISSDSKYGKYYAPSRIYIVSKKGSIPVCIDAWIKTSYTGAGAAETVPAMGLEKQISDPLKLSYSLAHVRINPQGRTLEYLQEIFYDKAGNVLADNIYKSPHVKEINSQAFDENFYDAIVDDVFHKGETEHAKASDRWLSLWRIVGPQTTSSGSADTTTIRKRGNDLIVWIWAEERDNTGGTVKEIKFYKEVFNLVTYNYKIVEMSVWTPSNGWQKSLNLDGQYLPIIPDSTQDIACHVLQRYAAENNSWVCRYQLDDLPEVPAAIAKPKPPATTPKPAPQKTVSAPLPAPKQKSVNKAISAPLPSVAENTKETLGSQYKPYYSFTENNTNSAVRHLL